jgi:hypothetical protein
LSSWITVQPYHQGTCLPKYGPSTRARLLRPLIGSER